MTETKGKFLILIVVLMRPYRDEFRKADEFIFEKTGKHWNELESEDWYSTDISDQLMNLYMEASPNKEKALTTFGKQVYQTIKRTEGFPPGLKTPLDYIDFEARESVNNIRGPNIKPRKFLKKQEGHVIVQTEKDDQNCLLLEGVFLGILRIAGVNDGKVEQKKCIRNGDSVCEFHITWGIKF